MSDKYDGEVIINTRLDTDSLEPEVKKVEKSVGKLNKTVSQSTKIEKDNKRAVDAFINSQRRRVESNEDAEKSFLGLNSSMLKGVGIIGGAVAAFKALSSAVKDTTEAYKIQESAEVTLEASAKNNPYLNGSAVERLKEYASQLQQTTVYGDEGTIQLMAQLAATGKTESQILDIIAASADLAASGMITFEGAVRNLSKTYSGMAGELGESIPALRTLTAEQMKNGEAIKLVQAQFANTAEATAAATGTAQQLSNAWGDLKEVIGEGLERPLAGVRRWITETISAFATGISEARKLKQATEADLKGTATLTQEQILYADLLKRQAAAIGEIGNEQEKLAESFYLKEAHRNILRLEAIENRTEAQERELKVFYEQRDLELEALNLAQKELEIINEQIKEREKLISIRQKEEASALQASIKEQEEADSLVLLNSHIKTVTDARNQNIKRMELEAKLRGEEISQDKILEEWMSAYISLVSGSKGLITENSDITKEWANEIKNMASNQEKYVISLEEEERIQKRITEMVTELSNAKLDLNETLDSILEVDTGKESDRLKALLKQLS